MMLKKFTDGLIFGGGFAISFIVIWYAAAYFIFPMFASSYTERVLSTGPSNSNSKSSQPPTPTNKTLPNTPLKQFHELEIEQQIEQASVIALAEYVPSENGKMKAVITELIKNKPGTTIYYNVGDEHPSSSYYPKEKTRHGDGLVIFFTGSPAQMKMSMTYSGDRILGLGDMPLKLLRKKCAEPNA
ncbi:MAG: hypothetical protein GY694_20075 [Gammaproteobacteria bacterium]|nr:hypothetical protein [Gammaproteobacteria bacterium]